MPFYLLSFFPFVFARLWTVNFLWGLLESQCENSQWCLWSNKQTFFNCECARLAVNFTSTALQLRSLLTVPNCGFHKLVSGREIWQFIQLLIHPNIHLVFYYNIHNSQGGRKVKLLTAFNISTFPITYFKNLESALFSLLSLKGSGVHTIKTAQRSSKLGPWISKFYFAGPILYTQAEMSTN